MSPFIINYETLLQIATSCEGCAYIDNDKFDIPCAECMRNCKDYWRDRNDTREKT